MPSNLKEKIIHEIERLPEKKMPQLYKIIRVISSELFTGSKNRNPKSLRGIWKGKIDDGLLSDAKRSVFPYEKI